MAWKFFVCFFVIFFIFKQSEAWGNKAPCAGHKVIVDEIKAAKGHKNPHGDIVNCTVTVNDKCEVIPRCCIRFGKQNCDTTSYVAKIINPETGKEKFKKEGTSNLCESMESKKWQNTLETYPDIKFLNKCPLSDVDGKAGIHCIRQGKTTLDIPPMAWPIAKGKLLVDTCIWDSTKPDIKSCWKMVVFIDTDKKKA